MDIIFDMDGVIIDSSASVKNRIIQVVEEFWVYENIKGRDLEQYIGLTTLDTFRDIFPKSTSETIIKKAAERMLQLFWQRPVEEAIPYPLIDRVLQELIMKGACLYIVTGRPLNAAISILTYYKLVKYFSAILSSSSRGESKVITVDYLIKNYEIDKSDCFFVGDRDVDIDAALRNYIYPIVALWGFGSNDKFMQLLPKNQFAETPLDIITVINNIRFEVDEN